MSQPTTAVASAIRTELDQRGISGRQLAEAMKWKRSTTARRLKGEHPFTVDQLTAIASYLGVPAASLIPDGQQAAS